MKCILFRYVQISIHFITLLYYSSSHAAVDVKNVNIVDITPSSFSVIYAVSEAATANIKIYSSNSISTEITNQFEVRVNPILSGTAEALSKYEQYQNKLALQASANSKGIVRLSVAGLTPSTNYYFQIISTAADSSTTWPETGLMAVTTASENVFIAHGAQLQITVDESNAAGYMVFLSNPQLGGAVSAVVGDGAADNQAVINLSNLFAADGSAWIASGLTTLDVNLMRGWNSLVTKQVSLDFNTDFSVATSYQANIGQTILPEITLLTPAIKTYISGFTYNLKWLDDAATNASVALYYDTDNTGNDGLLIVDSLAEDDDGLGDQYSWDLSNILDGVYYIYAEISDGNNTVNHYAPGVLAIDRSQVDSDTDGMADIWEMLYFETLNQPIGDADGDGILDLTEFLQGTDPTVVAPKAPTNLQVNAANSRHVLTWDKAEGATQYNVYWRFTAGVNKQNSSLIENVASPFSHFNTLNNTTYYYVVEALNQGGVSAVSAEVKAAYYISNPANPFDVDNDQISNYLDNCYSVKNNAQLDTDEDGIGNRCDADYNNDGVVTNSDYTVFVAQLGTSNVEMDFDGNGTVDALDDIIFQSYLDKAPGPGARVTGVDYSFMRSYFGQSNPVLDLNQDGVIDGEDYILLRSFLEKL